MQNARQIVRESIMASLAGNEPEMTLPAINSRLQKLQHWQMELLQLAVSAGADCLEYDEELQQVNAAKISLMAQKAELEKSADKADILSGRMEDIDQALVESGSDLDRFDEAMVRQLISGIQVVDKERIIVRFKDGMEIEQVVGGI